MGTDGFGATIGEATQQTRFLALNVAKAPFDNLAARQAVAYAVDQALISEAIFGGVETAAETLFDPSKPYCDVEVKTYPTDAETANALLDEAGYADTDGDGVREIDGEPIVLTFIYSQSFATLDDAVLANRRRAGGYRLWRKRRGQRYDDVVRIDDDRGIRCQSVLHLWRLVRPVFADHKHTAG